MNRVKLTLTSEEVSLIMKNISGIMEVRLGEKFIVKYSENGHVNMDDMIVSCQLTSKGIKCNQPWLEGEIINRILTGQLSYWVHDETAEEYEAKESFKECITDRLAIFKM